MRMRIGGRYERGGAPVGAAVVVVGAALIAVAAFANAHVDGSQYAAPAPVVTAPKGMAQVVLSGGCFWGMEAVFESLKGVSSAVAGYSGGAADTAHYDMVSTGETGHAESVEVTFDPSKISFQQLLQVDFLVAHDPTELDRQGPDEGSQYRSVVWYTSEAQHQETVAYIAQLEADKTFGSPIVTQVVPLKAFYPAEEYHQHFVQRNPDYPYVVINDLPKLAHLKQAFPDLVR
jgi:peptide-methionine (S)-S-oxide reductase